MDDVPDPTTGSRSRDLILPRDGVDRVKRWATAHPQGADALLAAAFAACGVLLATSQIPESVFVSLAVFLGMYTVGDLTPRPQAIYARLAVIVCAVALLSGAMIVRSGPGPWTPVVIVALTALSAVFFVAAWILGDAAHDGRQREQLLAERNRELQIQRAENARRAVLDERLRIARELHDVVAHSVSLIGIQAGAARRTLRRDPDVAEEALGGIERTSREAVGELQQLLGVLRDERPGRDRDLTREPQPGVDRLGALVEQTSAAGVHTDLTFIGQRRDLPSGLEVSAYRIVQEALTNTLRHARARKAEVLVRYEGDALEVEVLDDGRGPADPQRSHGRPRSSGGHGLLGMCERVSLHGGELETGARAGGGYRVWARLPAEPALPVGPPHRAHADGHDPVGRVLEASDATR